jgi:hypothetical protein
MDDHFASHNLTEAGKRCLQTLRAGFRGHLNVPLVSRKFEGLESRAIKRGPSVAVRWSPSDCDA